MLNIENPSAHSATGSSYRIVDRVLAISVVAIVILRLIASGFVPLIPQEAYYWMYSVHPSHSYFDHPPMIAWMISLGTQLFSSNEFGVRAIGQAEMLLASVVMYAFARQWYGRSASLIAALSLQILPLYAAVGFLATMDSSLVFWWLAVLLGFSLAVRKKSVAGWYLAGMGAGAVMLSKYTGVFAVGGCFLALMMHPSWRRRLRTVHPWLAVGMALLMFSPVIQWNFQHDWASFRFQLQGRYNAAPEPHAGVYFFVGEQLLAVTPVVLLGMGLLTWRWIRRPHKRLSGRAVIAVAFAGPLLLDFVVTSIHHDVHLNWTAPVYLSLIAPLAHAAEAVRRLAFRKGTQSKLPWLTASTVRICSVGMAMTFIGVLTWPLWTGHAGTTFGQWSPLAAAVDGLALQMQDQTHGQPLIVADGSFEVASEVAYYRRGRGSAASSDVTTSQWIINGKDGLGFPYWMRRSQWIGKDCIYVGPAKFLRQTVAGEFDSVEVIDLPQVHLDHPYAMAICRNFHNPILALQKPALPQVAAALRPIMNQCPIVSSKPSSIRPTTRPTIASSKD